MSISSGCERTEQVGVCDQEGMFMEQRHASCLPSWSLQEEQVDLLQNWLQPRYTSCHHVTVIVLFSPRVQSVSPGDHYR